MSINKSGPVYNNPVLLLQKLIGFNTTNPPGNEAECILFINNLLQDAGVETVILESIPGRLNLVARMKGKGNSRPFLMYGHADVVTADGQEWKYPPFEGIIEDGCVWGRGALDMKGALAMMICAVLRVRNEGIEPPCDIILAVVSDEENDGRLGAGYLVEHHKDLFRDVQYAIGELGGFTMHMAGKSYYPVMIAEKQRCCLRTIIKGPGGHGSIPLRNGAMAKLAYVLNRLNTGRLPVHITPPVRQMVDSLAGHLPFPQSAVVRGLLYKAFTDRILSFMGSSGAIFEPLLHNTVNATIVRGGDRINVIPGEIVLELDGRILPGFGPEHIINELKAFIGLDLEFEATSFDRGPEKVDMSLFDTLARVLQTFDPKAIPIPFVISGVTDARFFARLGIQTYGFTPMLLPEDLNFSKLFHAADERIPVEAVEFGTNAIFELLKRL